MKYLIFGTLAIVLLLLSQAQAQEWEVLEPSEVNGGASPTARTLFKLAAVYVKQKGKFESTDSPFSGDYYDEGDSRETVKFERRNTSTVTYYRYTFPLTEKFGNSTVNATVTVRYNPSNSNFVITNYNYDIDYEGQENSDNIRPGYTKTLIDARTLTGDGDLAAVVSESFDSVIADFIERDVVPEAEYSIQFVYGAYMDQYEGDEAVAAMEEGELNQEGEFNEEDEFNGEELENDGEAEILIVEEEDLQDQRFLLSLEEAPAGPQPGYRFYAIYLKVKNSEGKYYLLYMEINYTKEENGEFVYDKSNVLGNLEGLEKALI